MIFFTECHLVETHVINIKNEDFFTYFQFSCFALMQSSLASMLTFKMSLLLTDRNEHVKINVVS